jgi:transcriptional regulator with XRE-family HTH domain
VKSPANLCGPVVARLRRRKGITQEGLRQRCVAAGWTVARSVLAKIETRKRSVSDRELVALARALKASPLDLLVGSGRTRTRRNQLGKRDERA